MHDLIMKTIITLAITTLALLGTTPQADARPHRHSSGIYLSGYLACGTPVYKERYFVGYDSCGRPIWRTRVVHRHPRPVVRHYAAPCPPRVVIQGSFCR
jgi:hypothetical protein